jgi:hypothetical protein
MRFAYDLHLHSCLSPCADDDATPANLAGMAAVQELTFAALTDHNTCGNVRSFFSAAKEHPLLVPVAGMELCTSEEIHLVCLFPGVDEAERFEEETVRPVRVPVKNDPARFGRQIKMDAEDGVVGEEENWLIPAAGIDLESATEAVRALGGEAFPAHIDRPSYGLLSVLGMFPESPRFGAVEVAKSENIPRLVAEHALDLAKILTDSDAHRLMDVNGAEHFLDLPEPTVPALLSLFRSWRA